MGLIFGSKELVVVEQYAASQEFMLPEIHLSWLFLTCAINVASLSLMRAPR